MSVLGKLDDFKKQLTKNLLILTVVVVVFGGGIFVSMSKISASLKTISDVRRELALRNLSIRSLSALRTESLSAEPLLAPLRAKLPTRDELFSFSKKVEEIGSARRVQVSFTFGSENPAGPDSPASVGFSLVVSGKMSDAVAFLADMEKASYITKISNVDMSEGDSRISGAVFYK